AVSKPKSDKNAIVTYDITTAARDCFGEDRHRGSFDPEVHQVNKVTNLADNSATTFFRVVSPMFPGNPAGVYAIKNRQRRAAAGKEVLCFAGEGRKPAIKAHHQLTC